MGKPAIRLVCALGSGSGDDIGAELCDSATTALELVLLWGLVQGMDARLTNAGRSVKCGEVGNRVDYTPV